MPSNENIRKRIWLIPDGIPLQLDNMTIRTNESGKLLVTGWTSNVHFNNISKENILRELEELKSSFSDLSKSFTELNDCERECFDNRISHGIRRFRESWDWVMF